MPIFLSSQKIVKDWIDYNNHMNVSYYLLIFDKYGADTLNNIYKFNGKSIYLEVDGNFPNHPADPSDESNLTDLKNLIIDNDLDFGIAFDGDADRGVFIDNLGRVISGSMMTVLISEFLSSQKNEFRVVHNVNVSPHALKMMKDNNVELYRHRIDCLFTHNTL